MNVTGDLVVGPEALVPLIPFSCLWGSDLSALLEREKDRKGIAFKKYGLIFDALSLPVLP